MNATIYINQDNTATVSCPKCQRTRTVDVARYRDVDTVVTVKIRCSCGYAHTAILDKRRQFRRKVNFSGICRRMIKDRLVDQIPITIIDLSRTGLRFKLRTVLGFTLGDQLTIEFVLDDKACSVINKAVILKSITERRIGAAFTSALDPSRLEDRAIGFYLLYGP